MNSREPPILAASSTETDEGLLQPEGISLGKMGNWGGEGEFMGQRCKEESPQQKVESDLYSSGEAKLDRKKGGTVANLGTFSKFEPPILIGCHIENPRFANSATVGTEKLAYARLYIEVSAAQVVPEFVPLVNEEKLEFRQQIEYDLVPPRCAYCLLFGHSTSKCRENDEGFVLVIRRKDKRLWSPKEYLNLQNEEEKTVGSHVMSIPSVQGVQVEGRNSFGVMAEVEPLKQKREAMIVIEDTSTVKANDIIQLEPSIKGSRIRDQKAMLGNVRTLSKFWFSSIYAANDCDDRKQLWCSLLDVRQKIVDEPWLIGGDFKATRGIDETKGGALPK
ncbi:hypothetical protein LIER_10715 [Lithospermum erythrorhizon]|uniref:Zinc knuckle CX2CX4HX4C domain-containing protein n=1 Tax=Lithospermum erythrorhizon TaxID=34254 RepID=A0AAV3PK90_LITER